MNCYVTHLFFISLSPFLQKLCHIEVRMCFQAALEKVIIQVGRVKGLPSHYITGDPSK